MFYSFRVAAWPVSQRIPFLFDLSSLLQRGNYIFSIWRVSALFAFRVCVISFISSIYPPVVSVDYSFCSLNAHSVLSPCIFPSFLPSFLFTVGCSYSDDSPADPSTLIYRLLRSVYSVWLSIISTLSIQWSKASLSPCLLPPSPHLSVPLPHPVRVDNRSIYSIG